MSQQSTTDLIKSVPNEQLFQTVFENSAIGMALVAPNGSWLKVNKSICKIVGYTEDELLTKTFQDITHKDDLEKDLSKVQEMLDGKIKTYQLEKRYIHKKGQIVWILLNVSLVRDKDTKPLFFISEIKDVSQQKEYQLELEEKVRELKSLNKLMVDRELKMIELKEKLVTKATTGGDNKPPLKNQIKELDIG